MIKVLFVCHGNICRSPMAEFVFKDMLKKAGRMVQMIFVFLHILSPSAYGIDVKIIIALRAGKVKSKRILDFRNSDFGLDILVC